MTAVQLFAISGLLVCSCNQKPEIKYYWTNFNGSYNEVSDTNHIYQIEKTYFGDTTIIAYFAAKDTSTYSLLTSKRDSSFIISSYDDGYIRPFYDTLIACNNETFKLTKYIQNENVTDGSQIHYYTPETGFFAIHSGTWPGLKLLQSSDTLKNEQISLLAKLVVPKFFLRGPVE